MLQNINFTDPQGTIHTAATFKVRRADRHENSSSFISLQSDNFTTYDSNTPDPQRNVHYSVYYWSNETARLAGSAPYILANTENMTMDFSFNPDSTYDGLSLEDVVEKHLTDVVLPPMQIV